MSKVLKDQFIAAGIGGYNDWKNTTLAKQMDYIIQEKINQQSLQNENFKAALGHMSKMRPFLSSYENILGSNKTKHGEVAEHLEVNVRNAYSTLEGQAEKATFEGVGRTAPEDFIIDGVYYQSKFTNGPNNTLSHVLEHFEKYKDAGMSYTIPKDQYQIIEAVRNGQTEHLNEKTVRAILNKVDQLETVSGRSFTDMVKPSISNYDDVQLGRVSDTVTMHQENIIEENQKINDAINKESEEKLKSVEAKKDPSFGEGIKVVGAAAAIGATISALSGIYSKVKTGKKIQDFDINDWKELGVNSLKVGGKSALAAGSMYTLTNLTSLSAPFAGAVTSAAMGITSLVTDHQKGKLELDEFVTQGQILCIEAGIAAIGGAIGQTLIPVPILGSIIGSVSANILWGLAKDKLIGKEEELRRILNNYSEFLVAKIDEAYHEIVNKIEEKYAKFDSLIEAAFDLNANAATLAAASVTLARETGVAENEILKNDDELEAFFMN